MLSRAHGLLAAAMTAAALSTAHAQVSQPGAPYAWDLPAWAPPPHAPPDNPVTAAKVELGRRLFYDGRLAADGLRSCASCHRQALGFSDGVPLSWGVTGEFTSRNVPGLTNVGYLGVLTWRDPRVTSLESQALGPLFGQHPVEMGMAGQQEDMARRASEDALYRRLFAAAFPDNGGGITLESMLKAIASFERTLVSAKSPYDRYRHGGDDQAISESAKRGEVLFLGDRLKCAACHSGPNFTDASRGGAVSPYYNTGLYNLDGAGGYPLSNTGLASVTAQPADMGRFRTPSLRNVEVTAPYMHDGSLATLEEVIDFYAAGGRLVPEGERNAGDGRKSPLKDPRVSGFELGAAEKADLIAFLKSLTDTEFLGDSRYSDPWTDRQPLN
jgi:cytochrome c peroxidase